MSLNEWLLIKPRQKSNSREKEIDNIIKNLNDRKSLQRKRTSILPPMQLKIA